MGTSVTLAELKIMCQLTPTKKSAQAIYTGVFQSPFFLFCQRQGLCLERKCQQLTEHVS